MKTSIARASGGLLLATLLTSCASRPGDEPATSVPAAPPPSIAETPSEPSGSAAEARSFAILSVNDVYRIEGVENGARGGLARLRTLRRELEKEHPDLLVLHAGDFLYPSFASRVFDGHQMVDVMNLLDGEAERFDNRMFVTFGNHEFDQGDLEDAGIVRARVDESEFTWLGTNIRFRDGEDGEPLVAGSQLQPSALMRTLNGLWVGIFSLTTNVAIPEYVEEIADLEATAREATAGLRRRGADVVVALTHLEVAEDVALLEALGDEGPDLIIGGHDHQRQEKQAEGRWVLKGDADATSAVTAKVTVAADGGISVDHRLVDLGPVGPDPDPKVRQKTDFWVERHDQIYCGAKLDLPPGCLDDPVGESRVPLVAEEIEIRRYETNLGNWVTDRMLEAFADQGAQVAFINSGSLRLNQDLAPGTITRRNVEEIFAYPAPTRLLRIDGNALAEITSRSVEGWSSVGWWLQIAGFAYRHNPETATASTLTLLTPEGPRPIRPDEEILAVTVDFIAAGGDGYSMLEDAEVVADGDDVKDLVIRGLDRAGETGIAPEVEGRICNSKRTGPCLATGAAGGDSR